MGEQTEPHGYRHRSAAKGLAWMTVAVVFSKFQSFFSQIILGYVLAVESYAVFGISATSMARVGGFRNSGVSKALIQIT
jgi:hypothetical protein